MRVDLKRNLGAHFRRAREQTISDQFDTELAALVLNEYHDPRPMLANAASDRVALARRFFVDRKPPEVSYTPFTIDVARDIQRSAKRRIHHVVIEYDGEDAATFPQHCTVVAGRKNY